MEQGKITALTLLPQQKENLFKSNKQKMFSMS